MPKQRLRPIKPPRLRRGDLIGIVSPGGPMLEGTRLQVGVQYLERLGYHVVLGKHAAKVTGYLAGTDDERVEDLHAMFRNPEVRAVFCTRGGYGVSRLLQRIDYRLIARNPKVFVGFSDITALQLALWRKCRLVTFHGPMVGVEMAGALDASTEESFWDLVTKSSKGIVMTSETKKPPLHGGRANGRLLGGNLSLIISLLGTPALPDFTGSLLFFEEVSEEPYRIDRMLTQLRNAGVLQGAHGFVSGNFLDCIPRDAGKPSFTLEQVLRETAEAFRKPFLSELPFGHLPHKVTLPQGILARMDADSGSIELLESAVHG